MLITPLQDEEFNNLYMDLVTFIQTHFNWQDSNFVDQPGLLSREQCARLKEKFTTIQQALNKNYNLFVLDPEGNTLLHEASKNADNLLIRFLVNVGLDINRQNLVHETPLYAACAEKNAASVKLLLDLRADPNRGLNQGRYKKKPLYIAIDPENRLLSETEKADSANSVKMLIEAGADINERFGRSRFAAIHHAIMDTRILLVKTIIESGKADLSLLDKDGNSVLHMVPDYRNEGEQKKEKTKMQEENKIAALLISHLDAINVVNKLGNTPFHRAVIYANDYVARLLLKKDYLFPQLKLLSMQNSEGMTPIQEAVRSVKQGTKNLALLLRVATQDDLAIRNSFRETALDMAENTELRVENSKKLIKEFLQWTVYIKELPKQGYVPIKERIAQLLDVLQELRKVTERESQLLFTGKINQLIDAAIRIKAKAKLRQVNIELQPSFESLMGEIKNLIEEVDGHYRDYFDKAYFNNLKKAAKLLKQSDYLAWKEKQLRLSTSFPGLETNHPSWYDDLRDQRYDTAKSLYNDGLYFDSVSNYQEAKNKLERAIEFFEVSALNHIALANAYWSLGLVQLKVLNLANPDYAAVLASIEESIRIYSNAKAYNCLELPYQTLADIQIRKGRASFYETQQKSILSSQGSTRIEKLAAHLALAGLYQTIRKQGSTLPGLAEHESYHYNKAYELSQGELDDNAHVVLQREMGITKNAKLGTYNIQQCVAAIAHDPISGKVVLSHFDRLSGPLTFIDELLKEFPGTAKMNLYLSGGRDRSNGRAISDSNIDQVLKQIYAHKHRFSIKSTDLGDKPSPVAIVFDPVSAKLTAAMPNHADNSLDSRAAMMNLPLTKQGYLHPLTEIDFHKDETTRQRIYTEEEKQKLRNAYAWSINNPTGTEAWRHNQILFPLMRMNKATAESSMNFNSALLTTFAHARANLAPLQQPAQQIPAQNPELIDLLALQNGQFPDLSALDEISLEELEELLADLEVPPTRTCHRQKRAADTHCLLSLEEDEQRNLKEEKQSSYKMDSSILFEHLNSLDEVERSKILQKLAFNKILIVGDKKTKIEALIRAEQRKSHIERVSTISRGLTNGLMLKDTLSDIIHGKFGNVAMNIGFVGSSHAFDQLAKLAVNTGEKLVVKGSAILLGKALKVSSPFVGRASSALIVYDLSQQISALKEAIKNGDSDAKTDVIVNIVSDNIFIGTDLVEMGIEVAEISGAIAGVSSVAGPVGEAVGAVVMLGVQIYSAVRAVEHLDHFVHLSNWEKFKEGWRAFLGMEPEAYLEEMVELANAYDKLLAQKLNFLQGQTNIRHYIFAALEKIETNCREVTKYVQCKGKYARLCSGTKTFTECDTEFLPNNQSIALLDRRRNNFELAREPSNPPSDGEFSCFPTGNYKAIPAEGAYRCDNAIGIIDTTHNKTGSSFLFEFTGGIRTINGSLDDANFFILKNGEVTVYGGEQNDLFGISGNSVQGSLDGSKGEDTLDLSGFDSSKSIVVDFTQSKELTSGLTISNIEHLIGRESQSESVVVACNTQVLNTQGGTAENKDVISIPRNDCGYELQALLHPDTEIVDNATKGNITYTILPGKGTITINSGNVFASQQVERRVLFNDSLHNLHSISFNSTLMNSNAAEKILYFHFLTATKDYVVQISPILLNSAFYFKEGIELKLGNQNIYAIANMKASNIDIIIKEYSTIAHRLNISFFISTPENEIITIGAGKQHQVLSTDANATRNHMVGSGGENIFVIKFDLSSASFPLSEVVLYSSYDDKYTDSIDFRPLVKQVLAAFSQYQPKIKLIISEENEDVIIKLGLDSANRRFYKIVIVRLRAAAIYHWYKKLHIMLNVAPQQIVGSLSDLRLEPIPLEFDERHSLIVLGSKDVEENTTIILNREFDRYEFFRDGDNLIVTNALAFFLSDAERCQILLEGFYKDVKLQTLSIEFLHQKIALNATEIYTAADFNETQSMRNEVFYHLVLNQTGPIRANSSGNGLQRNASNELLIEARIHASHTGNTVRQRRSIDTAVKEQQIRDIAFDYYDTLDNKKPKGVNKKNNKTKQGVAHPQTTDLSAPNRSTEKPTRTISHTRPKKPIRQGHEQNVHKTDLLLKQTKGQQVNVQLKLMSQKPVASNRIVRVIKPINSSFFRDNGQGNSSLSPSRPKLINGNYSYRGSNQTHHYQQGKGGIKQVTARGDTQGLLALLNVFISSRTNVKISQDPKRERLAQRVVKVRQRIQEQYGFSKKTIP
jgi:ankyrin repeat protein